MANNFTGVFLRFFKANKFLSLSTVIGIALSVSIVCSMIVYLDGAEVSLKKESVERYGAMDLSIGYNAGQNEFIDEKVISSISSMNQVEKVSPILLGNFIVNNSKQTTYGVGIENDELSKSKYHFKEDISQGEISLNKALASSLSLDKNDFVDVEGIRFKVKEILEELDERGPSPDILIMSKRDVEKINSIKTKDANLKKADYLLVSVKDKHEVLKVADKVKSMYANIRIDVAQDNEFLKNNLKSLEKFIIFFSFLLLIVIALLIIANFDFYLYKNQKEFAVLRTIGAKREQVFKILFFQGSLMNVIGTSFGVAISFGLHKYGGGVISRFLLYDIPDMPYNFLKACWVALISMLTIELFLVFSALKGLKIAPLQSFKQADAKENTTNFKRYSKVFLFIGFIPLLLSVTAQGNILRTFLIIIASSCLFLGFYFSFLVYFEVWISKLFVFSKFKRNVNLRLALMSVSSQLKRNKFIVLSIMILMVISIFSSSLLRTFENNDKDYIKAQFPTDTVVTVRSAEKSIINFDDFENIFKKDHIRNANAISTISAALIEVDGKYIKLNYSLASIKNMKAGQYEGFKDFQFESTDNNIVLTSKFAEKYHLSVGEKLNIAKFGSTDTEVTPIGEVRISGIISKLPGSFADAYVDSNNEKLNNQFTHLEKVFLSTIQEDELVSELDDLKSKYPNIEVTSLDEALKTSKMMFQQRWGIFILIIIIVILSVIISIFNVLINNINSKRKEFAIMRALSMGRPEVKGFILMQVFIYIFLGMLFGILLGFLFVLLIGTIDTFLQIDYTFLFLVVIGIIFCSIFVFVPQSIMISNKKIIDEIKHEVLP